MLKPKLGNKLLENETSLKIARTSLSPYLSAKAALTMVATSVRSEVCKHFNTLIVGDSSTPGSTPLKSAINRSVNCSVGALNTDSILRTNSSFSGSKSRVNDNNKRTIDVVLLAASY